MHPSAVGVDTVVGAIQEEIDRIATEGVDDEELARVRARLRAQLLRQTDQVISRTQQLAMFEQQRGRAELVWELPDQLAKLTGRDVQRAAARLTADAASVLVLKAGAAA